MDYHILFLNITHITKRFILLNMLFILSISLGPFATAFAGTNYQDPFAIALLGFSYFIMNLFFGLLYTYAMYKKLTPDEFWTDNKSTGIYSLIGILILLASIPLAYVHTYISFALFILVFTGHLAKKR